MKKTVTTLDCKAMFGNRKSGRTTRQVDFAIQELFHGKKVKVQDHLEYGDNIRANRHLLKKIIDRLSIEHYHHSEILISSGDIIIHLNK